MKDTIVFLTLGALFLLGCTTNQKVNGKREGVWTTSYAMDSINNKMIYRSKEVYKHGIPKGTWKITLDGKLIKKEKYYKDSSALVKEYHPNGKLMKKGRTYTQETKKGLHWFYSGPWEHFDENGKLFCVKYYENGLHTKTDSIR